MTTNNRGLFFIVIGLAIILLMGFGALIMGLILKTNKTETLRFQSKNEILYGKITPQISKPLQLNIPRGFIVKSVSSNRSQISVYGQKNNLRQIIIFETNSGKRTNHYVIKEGP